MTGLSLIVTLKEQLDKPHEFTAVHVTIVVPVGKNKPEEGEQDIVEGDPLATGSVHVTKWLSHCVMLFGQEVITGMIQFWYRISTSSNDPLQG